MVAVVFRTALRLASKIWRDIREPCTTWPNKLVGLTCDADEDFIRDTSEELFRCSECCVDKNFTLKVKRKGGTPEGLRSNHKLIAAIRAWSWKKKVANMSCERLLKHFRTASPHR